MLPLPLYIMREVLWHIATIPSRVINTCYRHGEVSGSMNQTFSARCHIEAMCGDPRWQRRERVVNAVCFWEDDHCERSWRAMLTRASKTVAYNDKRLYDNRADAGVT